MRLDIKLPIYRYTCNDPFINNLLKEQFNLGIYYGFLIGVVTSFTTIMVHHKLSK